MHARPEKAVTAMIGIEESKVLPFTTAPTAEGRSRDEVVAQLFHSEYAGLLRLAYCIVGDRCAAEDVVMEAFCSLYRHWSRMRRASAPLPYLRSKVILGSRSVIQQRHPAAALLGLQGDSLGDAVRALPARQREVIVCRCYLELSESETAELLGLTAGSVKRHAHRARVALPARCAMNELELRLREELHRGDADIEVTEADLRHVEHRFHRRRGDLGRRRSRTTLAVAVAIAIGAGAVLTQNLVSPDAAVEPPSPDDLAPAPGLARLPLTPENLAGTWMMPDQSGWLWTFRADDGFTVFNAGEPDSGEVPQSRRYSLTATGFTVDDWCTTSDAVVDSAGGLHVTLDCAPDGEAQQVSLTKVSPETAGSISLRWTADPPARVMRPLDRVNEMRGGWLKQGTGLLLLITRDPETGTFTYRLDDDGDPHHAPDDDGSAQVDRSGLVTLTSSADSAQCTAGAQVVLSGMRPWGGPGPLLPPPLGNALEATIHRPGDCTLHEALEGTWLRVS